MSFFVEQGHFQSYVIFCENLFQMDETLCFIPCKLFRRLHQRKQNYEIYKYLRQQILFKSQEVKVLREKKNELKMFQKNVSFSD